MVLRAPPSEDATWTADGTGFPTPCSSRYHRVMRTPFPGPRPGRRPYHPVRRRRHRGDDPGCRTTRSARRLPAPPRQPASPRWMPTCPLPGYGTRPRWMRSGATCRGRPCTPGTCSTCLPAMWDAWAAYDPDAQRLFRDREAHDAADEAAARERGHQLRRVSDPQPSVRGCAGRGGDARRVRRDHGLTVLPDGHHHDASATRLLRWATGSQRRSSSSA